MRHFKNILKNLVANISIHAPAKGATSPSRVMRDKVGKFQSTHPRRVRPIKIDKQFNYRTFQSTHPRRVRRINLRTINSVRTFQSTHPRRVRPINLKFWKFYFRFQSTHPRRVRRLLQPRTPQKTRYFNPRTREGCDETFSYKDIIAIKFQSTHPRRVRHSM